MESTVKVKVVSSFNKGSCNSCGFGNSEDKGVVEIATDSIVFRLCNSCLDDMQEQVSNIYRDYYNLRSKREIAEEKRRTFEKIMFLNTIIAQEENYKKSKAVMTELYRLKAYLEALTWVLGGEIDGETKRC